MDERGAYPRDHGNKSIRKNTLLRLINVDEQDGITFALQLFIFSELKFDEYEKKSHLPCAQKQNKFGVNKFYHLGHSCTLCNNCGKLLSAVNCVNSHFS
jgi:hypothetical protein